MSLKFASFITKKRKTLSFKGWFISHIKVYMSYIVTFGKLLVAYIAVHLFRRKLLKKDLWLIQEKRTEARDNGYHLYKYIRENYDYLPVYYVITTDSSDYNKVAKYQQVIKADSFLHYMYYIASKYSINSQQYGAAPYPSGWTYRFRKFCRCDQKVVYLKHGIYKDELSHDLDYSKAHFSLICCAAEKERQFIMKTYGYPDNKVRLLGLCRFDKLFNHNNNTQKQILIMPTFRNYLVSGNREKEANSEEEKRFKESTFFKCYNTLLTDERLLKYAKEKGYRIIFYLHYSLQSYTHTFMDCCSEIVTIADRKKYDVQKLLIDSSVLVTDFSSVFFDFAYMGKPEVFYQFDEDEYRSGHYKKGYFDYRRDAFGPVIIDRDELIEYLIGLMDSNCLIEQKYLDRINQFFTLRDAHNCERTYNAIINL